MEAIAIAGTAVSTMGAMAGAQQQEFASESRARIAKTQRDQSQTNALADLKRTLGNIKAIRASANAPTTTPTAQAIMDEETTTSDINRRRETQGFENEIAQGRIDRGLYDDMKWFYLGSNALRGLGQVYG